jgi:hypothetical protein
MGNEEPHKLYSSSNISEMIYSRRRRGAGIIAGKGERFVVGKTEGKRPLRRPR